MLVAISTNLSSGSGKVLRIRTAVVLSAPLGPIRPMTVLFGTSRSSPSSATTLP